MDTQVLCGQIKRQVYHNKKHIFVSRISSMRHFLLLLLRPPARPLLASSQQIVCQGGVIIVSAKVAVAKNEATFRSRPHMGVPRALPAFKAAAGTSEADWFCMQKSRVASLSFASWQI